MSDKESNTTGLCDVCDMTYLQEELQDGMCLGCRFQCSECGQYNKRVSEHLEERCNHCGCIVLQTSAPRMNKPSAQ